MDVQGTEMIEKLRRSFRKGQETAPLFTGRHTGTKLQTVHVTMQDPRMFQGTF